MPLAKHYKSLRGRSMRGATQGFTLLEIVFVVAIGMVMTTISVPMTKTALKAYRFNQAVTAVTNAIQRTRYQAIMHGYRYNLSFNQANQSYQVASKVPPAATFSNVGTATPWGPNAEVALNAPTTLEFLPGGTVTATTGSMSFSLTNGTTTKTITVSGVGNVRVSE
jgi:Tfp pilus assembly protein FimT